MVIFQKDILFRVITFQKDNLFRGWFFFFKKEILFRVIIFQQRYFLGWLFYKKIFFSGRFLKKIFSGYIFFTEKIFFSGWLYRLHIAGSACFCKGGFCEGKNLITICDYHFCNDEFSISVNTVSNILLFELSPLLLSRLKAWALGSPISPFSMLRTSKVTVMMMVLGVVAIMMVMVAMMMVMTMIMIMTTKKLRMIIVICFLISMLCASKVIAMAIGSQKKMQTECCWNQKS